MAKKAVEEGWSLGSTDVRTAFLQAPRREPEGRLTIVQPPAVLFQAGILPKGTLWRVHRALYGFTESPQDWAAHRDETLPKMRWFSGESGKKRFLRHVWELVEEEEKLANGKQSVAVNVIGYIAIYVDDVLGIAPKAVLSEFFEELNKVWQFIAGNRSDRAVIFTSSV